MSTKPAAAQAAAPYLKSGRLVALLQDWCPTIPGLFLYYSGQRRVPPALRAFIDVLREELPHTDDVASFPREPQR